MRRQLMEPDFEIGDVVLWLPDGDIGVIVDVDHSVADEPFNVEWHIDPVASGWHSAYSDCAEDPVPAMVRLGG